MKFSKYNGAGNDFVLIDNREGTIHLTSEQIAFLCHRRLGIGADGLLLLEQALAGYHFAMRYYNSDGLPATMCGNGARCIATFAYQLGLGEHCEGYPTLRFLADDGPHEAQIVLWHEQEQLGIVTVSMCDVDTCNVKRCLDGWLLDTGVPHYVQRVSGLEHYDVVGEGRRLRHLPDLGPEGANVNFMEDMPDGSLHVRTYERGVEDETWACGTGVTACAIVSGNHRITTRGGHFKVDFQPTGTAYTHVRLTGPVALNFSGDIEI